MTKTLKTIIYALVTYIVSNQLITSLVTGTTTGDTLITTILPIALAAGVLIVGLGLFGNQE